MSKAMGMTLTPEIGIVRTKEGKLKVATATLWKEYLERDFPGVLAGMLGRIYDDESEIEDAVHQILEDLDIYEETEVIFYEADTGQNGESLN